MMRPVIFVSLLAITLVAAVMAWHWRSDRLVAVERLQRGRAVPLVSAESPVASVPPVSVLAALPAQAEADEGTWAQTRRDIDRFVRLREDPKLVKLHAKQSWLGFRLRDGAFLRSRNLTEADQERLIAAWVQRGLDGLKSRVLVQETSPSFEVMETSAKQLRSAHQKMQAVEAEVLGPDGVVALAEYREGQRVRDIVMQLQGDAALAGQPLTLDQTDAVSAILAHAGAPGRRQPGSSVDPAIAERMLAGVLSPEQIDLLLLPERYRIADAKFMRLVREITMPLTFGTARPR